MLFVGCVSKFYTSMGVAPGRPLGTGPVLRAQHSQPARCRLSKRPSTPPPSLLQACLSRLLRKCNLSQATFNYLDAVF